jgi:hypothetical protein
VDVAYYLPISLTEYTTLSIYDRRVLRRALVDFLKGKPRESITGGPPKQEKKLGL